MQSIENIRDKPKQRIKVGFGLIDVVFAVTHLAILFWFSLILVTELNPSAPTPIASKSLLDTLAVLAAITSVMTLPLTWLHFSVYADRRTSFPPLLTISFINFCAFAVGSLVATLSLGSTLIAATIIFAKGLNRPLQYRYVLLLQSIVFVVAGLIGQQFSI